MSVVAPAGFRAAYRSGRDQTGGIARRGARLHGRRQAGERRGRLHLEPRHEAAPVTVSREHLAASAGVATGVVLTSGNANTATGQHGIDAARTICREVAERLEQRGDPPARLPDGADRCALPCACRRRCRRAPRGRPRGRRRRRGAGGEGDPHDRHPAQGGWSPPTGSGRRHGQGGRHARAEHGDDAGGAHDRRRGAMRDRCASTSAWRRARPSTSSVSTAARRPTTPSSCWRAAPPDRSAPDHLGLPMPAASAQLAQMAADAEGATLVARVRVIGARTAADAHRGGAAR